MYSSTLCIHQNIEQPRIIESFNLELKASEVINNGAENYSTKGSKEYRTVYVPVIFSVRR